MAESFKFTGNLADAVEVFPDLDWRASADGTAWVYNSKEGEHIKVEKGQYIVKIADRYEVHDEEPKNAHEAQPVEQPAEE